MSEEIIRDRLVRELGGYTSVLDVGSGPGKYTMRLADWITRREAVDAHGPYLEDVAADWKYHGRAEELLPTFPTGHVDAVICLDMLEHLEKSVGYVVLHELRRVAAQKAIVFTPDGFHPQSSDIEWQVHRSGWSAKELEHFGYRVEAWDFDYGKGNGMSRALWAVAAR